MYSSFVLCDFFLKRPAQKRAGKGYKKRGTTVGRTSFLAWLCGFSGTTVGRTLSWFQAVRLLLQHLRNERLPVARHHKLLHIRHIDLHLCSAAALFDQFRRYHRQRAVRCIFTEGMFCTLQVVQLPAKQIRHSLLRFIAILKQSYVVVEIRRK